MQQKKFSKKVYILLFLFILCLAAGAYLYRKNHHPSIVFETQQNEKKEGGVSNANSNTNFFFDFESLNGLAGAETIKATTAHSGKMACSLSGGIEYGPSVIKKMSDITALPIKKVSASVWVYPLTDNPNTVLTVSIINSKNETVFWDGKSTEKQNFQKNKWTKINAQYNLPSEKISPDDIVHVNIWNKGKTEIIIDDLEIVYGESAERRGVDAKMDANVIYEKQFVPQRNKPPFKTIYFEKQEINNQNSTFITPTKDNPLADFSPNDEFLVGNFIADKNNLDELICIKKESAAMFEYAAEEQQFNMLWETTATEKTVWNDETKKIAGDFNADGKTDLLIVNRKKGSWELFDFNNKNWNLVLKGNDYLSTIWLDDNNKAFVSKLFSKDNKDALIILNKNNYSTLQLNRKTNAFEETKVDLSPYDTGLFSNTSCVYDGNFDGGTGQQFLKFDTEWRFDLKLIGIDATGFNIINTIDFKGYSNDYNPKYYEFVKIISGKFVNSAKTSLLLMMRNCADNNFNGKHCNQFENVPSLPNSTALYNF